MFVYFIMYVYIMYTHNIIICNICGYSITYIDNNYNYVIVLLFL